MSRSIHETAGDWRREARFRDSKREHKLERLRAISDALDRKRAIKKAARRARKISLPPAPVNPDAIPVDILADHEAVKHPASVEDIRAVLRRLPLGTLDGLSGIRLCAADRGIDAPEILEEFSVWEERDPLIGRFPLDHGFGVWSWPLLGLYEADSCRVEVYGCVYDSSLLPEHDLRLFVLKVETLYVLLHEIAHHVQHLSRFIQGAPQTKKTARQEYTADEFVMRNFEQAVLPVLQEAYADDLSRLDRCLIEKLGIPFAEIASCLCSRGQTAPSLWGASWDELIPIIEASPDSDLQQLRVDFADGLHYREVYHIGLRVLEAVLLENPDHTDALTTKADILLHQGHKQQALAVLRRANEISPHHPHILNPLLPALLQTANLDEVLAITDSVLDTDAGELNDTCMRARAIAFLLSADHESAQAAAERISGSEGPWATTAIRALAALWDNRAEEALTIACETLNTATSRDWNALLRMIRYDAASRLGRMDKAGMVKKSDIHVVSYIGLVEWSEEFEKMYRFSGGWRD